MKTKFGMRALSLLMVLALAGALFAPVVSAEENEILTDTKEFGPVDEKYLSTVAKIDLNDIKIPDLKFNEKQSMVSVDNELSPDENTDSSSLIKTITVDSESSISKIPFGSIIYHSKNGITTVFDSDGTQLFSAEDKNAAEVITPQGESPATYVHELPSGFIKRVLDDKTFIFYKGELILTVIDEAFDSSMKESGEFLENNPLKTSNKLTTMWDDWIEYAESSVISLTRFETTWKTPKRPLNQGLRQSIAIFNGIQTDSGSGIMQPVLMWNHKDNEYEYSGSAWDYQSALGGDSYHSTPITVSVNDNVRGRLQWSDTYNMWWISFDNLATSQTTTYYSTQYGTSGLRLYMTLESTGVGIIAETDSLPGDITFKNIIIKNGASDVPVTFYEEIVSGAITYFPYLDVTFYPSQSNPSEVKLWTGRG